MIFNILDFFCSKFFLNTDYVLKNEFKKLSILRILTGVIIFSRFFEIFLSYLYLYGFNKFSIIFLSVLLVILLFTIGFLTPIVNFILIVGLPILDSALSTKTLGTTILVNLLVVLLLTNSGRYFSVDYKLLVKNNIISKLILKVYKFVGFPDIVNIKRAYFLGFLLYAISSFYALLLHIQDPYWIGGVTIKSMLSNSFLCKHALIFRELESVFPVFFDIISISGIVFQSIFQILMIPLIFFRLGKKFIKIWGFIFFTFSLFFLSLSYLPHLELILWIIIFCPFQPAKEKIKIFYDDKCNLYQRSIPLLKWSNINEIYNFFPLSVNKNQEEYSLSLLEADIKKQAVGFYEGKSLRGYDLCMLIVKKNPLFFFFYPLFWIGKITRTGQYLYNLITKRKYELLGSCKISFNNKLIFEEQVPIKQDTYFTKFLYLFYFICIFLFVIINNSFYDKILRNKDLCLLFKRDYVFFCKNIGIEAPQVFNNTDLSMGDNFMTIKKFKNNKWELIPFTSTKGERLNYLDFDILLFSNHNSDLLYFGNSLVYRRMLITKVNAIEKFHNEEYGRDQILFRIKYDYIKSKEVGNVKYYVEVFTSNSSKVKLFAHDSKRHDLIRKFEKVIIYNGNIYR